MCRSIWILLILILVLNGCVAVWGDAHKITEARSESLVIQYASRWLGVPEGNYSQSSTAPSTERKQSFVEYGTAGSLFGIIEGT